MAEFIPDEAKFADLKGRIVVLTGGATGIGAATVIRLHGIGARVVFGDIANEPAQELVSSLETSSSAGGEVSFVHCDVTNYDDIYNLFKVAYNKYGRIDHAFACAGIFEKGQWFDPELTIESVKNEKGPSTTLDINLLGLANFSRVAVVFMRENMQKGENKSLTFMSSVNAFRESPGLYMYQTSKHAVQGLMRSMRKPIFERDGIRINTVNPGVTESPMTAHLVHVFKQPGYYCQPPDDVARMVLGLQVRTDMNGKGIYVEGGSGWEFEDSFYREQPAWLGEEPTRRMRANAEAVNKVSDCFWYEPLADR
jgi:NAD(P)-dependent dehydrogenase (short-subunit alcohol dehydrogenase family)